MFIRGSGVVFGTEDSTLMHVILRLGIAPLGESAMLHEVHICSTLAFARFPSFVQTDCVNLSMSTLKYKKLEMKLRTSFWASSEGKDTQKIRRV